MFLLKNAPGACKQGQLIHVPTETATFPQVSTGLQMTVTPLTASELETCQILIHLIISRTERYFDILIAIAPEGTKNIKTIIFMTE